jgi:hypothetical protein
MIHFPHEPQRMAALDHWALAIATALIVLIVAGVLPRVTW